MYAIRSYYAPEFAAKVGAAFAATFGKKVVLSTSRDT